MNAAHTDGPWSKGRSTDGATIFGSDGRAIAGVHSGPHAIENIALILSAPALLSALQQAADQMDVAAGVLWSRADGLDNLHKLAANALRNSAEKLKFQADSAHAAIAKAVQP